MRKTLNEYSEVFILIALIFLFLPSCKQDEEQPKPAPSALKNNEDNPVTRREMMVREFQTTEVQQLPNSLCQFVIRTTNGSIWYVSFDSHVGHTLLFKGSGPIEQPFFMDPGRVDETLAKLREIQQLLTNITALQLSVHLSNDAVMIEDEAKKK